MADLSVSMVGNSTDRLQTTVSVSSKAADTLKEQIKEDSSRKEHIKEVLKDVISVSKDGDTAQASKTSQEKLKESDELGDVRKLDNDKKSEDAVSATRKLMDRIKQEQENKPSPAEKMRKTLEEAQQLKAEKKESSKESNNHFNEFAKSLKDKSRNYDTYTEAQLQDMYVTGKITRYDYDHEMSKRESSDEAKRETGNEKVFQEGIVKVIENFDKADIKNDSIDRAFSEYANENLRAEQRMAMMDAAEFGA